LGGYLGIHLHRFQGQKQGFFLVGLDFDALLARGFQEPSGSVSLRIGPDDGRSLRRVFKGTGPQNPLESFFVQLTRDFTASGRSLLKISRLSVKSFIIFELSSGSSPSTGPSNIPAERIF
jgi:hypothetical protein